VLCARFGVYVAGVQGVVDRVQRGARAGERRAGAGERVRQKGLRLLAGQLIVRDRELVDIAVEDPAPVSALPGQPHLFIGRGHEIERRGGIGAGLCWLVLIRLWALAAINVLRTRRRQ
jgi:hypothetical protein